MMMKFCTSNPTIRIPYSRIGKTAIIPSIYEINATLDTLKKMYSEQVKELEKGLINTQQGEENLRNIATNYQSIKSILFQPR